MSVMRRGFHHVKLRLSPGKPDVKEGVPFHSRFTRGSSGSENPLVGPPGEDREGSVPCDSLSRFDLQSPYR